MDSPFDWGPTRMWDCAHCGAQNFTAEDDLFSDQCRHCTLYNEIDWSGDTDVTVAEAAELADEMAAE